MSSILSTIKRALSGENASSNDQQHPLLNVSKYRNEDVSRSTSRESFSPQKTAPQTDYAPLNTANSSERLTPGPPQLEYLDRDVQSEGKRARPQWRRALLLTTCMAGSVLLLNVIWLVIVITRCETVAGVSTLYQGSCNTASKLNLWLHIAINVLSTALFGASNYAMQCLNSPTREDVDRAHKRGKWLSIGLVNMKNLAYLPKRRVVLFVVLFLSTWPLHFVWNSIIFSTRQTNMYNILVVTPDFLSSSTFDDNLNNIQNSGGISTFKGFDFSGFSGTEHNIVMSHPSVGRYSRSESQTLNHYTGQNVKTFSNSSQFLSFSESLYQESKKNSMQRLDAATCMQEYSVTFLSSKRNLFVVLKSPVVFPWNQASGNGSILAVLDSRNWQQDLTTDGGVHWNPSAWMCSSIHDSAATLAIEGSVSYNNPKQFVPAGGIDLACNINKASSNLKTYNNWTIASQVQNQTYEVDYCLSEVVPEKCQVQFSVYLMGIVLICNLCKFISMVLTRFAFISAKPPLVVLGDAIASYLDDRDVSSEGICLLVGPDSEKHNFNEGTKIDRAKKAIWTDRPKRWSDVVRGTWMTLLILVLAVLGFAIGMLAKGTKSLGLQSFNSLSFGSTNPSTLLLSLVQSDNVDPTSDSGWLLLKTVMIANSPQLYFSLLYFFYNRSYTAMLGMVEWTNFALQRKSLRVSNPVGIQRSTYWLQLPYVYSIPLLVGSGLVHWILSEALFLVRISFFDRTGAPTFPTSDSTLFNASSNTLTVPGYSPKAILAAILVSAIMLAVLIWNEFRSYKSAMPLVVNSSFAISAACHRPDGDEEASKKRVMWGALSHQDGELPGHCSFTSWEVEKPRVGDHYE